MKFVIGIDVGSGSVRAGIFSVKGDSIIFKSKAIKIRKFEGEFVEQSSTDIWESICIVVRDAIKESNINIENIIGIGFDATCSLVALDKEDNPISINQDNDNYWNIIMWMDHRADKETELINSKKYDVLKYVGGKISVEMEIPKILWIKNNIPNTYNKIDKFFDLTDFLQYKASGNDIRSSCTVTCKWNYLAYENMWNKEFIKDIGLIDLLDNNKIGTNIQKPGSIAGFLTEKSAEELGLHTKVKVAVGMIDAHAGGLGALRSTANETLVIVAGTSACHMLNKKEATFIDGVWGPYYNAMFPEMWLNEGGQSAYGSLLDYTLRSHSYYNTILKNLNNNHNQIYIELNKEVQRLKNIDPYMIKDLHVLDFHYGNRSPISDPKNRGMVIGLDMEENLESMAKLYWATINSICFGTKHIIEVARKNGYKINEIIVCGGLTKNQLYMEELANICNQRIYFAGNDEAVVFGSAILAAIASDEYKTFEEAILNMSKIGKYIEPNPKFIEYYNKKYSVYLELYKDKLKYENIMI